MRTAFYIAALFFSFSFAYGQQVDSVQFKKTYYSLVEASKEPLKVYRLNLSNLPVDSFPVDLSKFRNLRYLCLNNDHIEFIPRSVGDLENLQTLELNGDDFKTLPAEMAKLKNLQEIYLNVNKKIDLTSSVKVLSGMPNLKVLHLESDGIKALPSNISSLTHLEKLYLGHNNLTEVPSEIKSMKSLQYLDLKDNNIPTYKLENYKTFGVKINF
jgi:Leucine-rich repeat (LRR) protein